MKHVFLFLFSLCFGIAAVFAWKIYSPFSPQTAVLQKTSFSLSRAPKLSLQATIATLSGDVLWQSRTATQASVLLSPRVIQQGEQLETHNTGSVTIELSAIGIMTLFPKTTVNLIQTLPADIVFDLSQGTVHIVKMTVLPPFSVRTPGLLITIPQGESNIAVNPETSQSTIMVQTGSLTLSFDDRNNLTNVFSLYKGDRGKFDPLTKIYTNY